MRFLFLSFVIFATSCGTVQNPFDKSEEKPEERSEFDDAYNRLVSDFLHEGNYIVSRRKDGSPGNPGEAILWTGVAAGALPCEKAKPFMEFLAEMSLANGGYFERYKPLGTDYENRPINFDGMSGVYFAYSGYLSECEVSETVRRSWEYHKKFIEDSRGKLHPDISEQYPDFFAAVPAAISYRTGLGQKPSKESLKIAAASAATWAAGVVASKSACYRIHLAYLNLKALENLGLPSGRGAFCKATGKLGKPEETAIGMPLIDHWCGRDGLTEWLDDFKPNVWEYRFQRCEWEKPDGRGYQTPGLDYLVAYSELFKARLK